MVQEVAVHESSWFCDNVGLINYVIVVVLELFLLFIFSKDLDAVLTCFLS